MMAHKQRFVIVIVVSLMAVLTGCGPDAQGQVSVVESDVQTDAEALAFYLNLVSLAPPQSVQWVQRTMVGSSRVPGPTDYQIVAILAYNQPTADFAEQLGLAIGHDLTVSEEVLGSWMPEAVVGSFHKSEAGSLQFDGPVYEPGDLLMPVLSYGYVAFVDHFIVIYGGTM